MEKIRFRCRTMHCANSPAHVAYNSTFEEFGWFFAFFRCLLQTANHLNPVDIQGIPREQHGKCINRRIDWQGLHSGLFCFSKNFARNLDLKHPRQFPKSFFSNDKPVENLCRGPLSSYVNLVYCFKQKLLKHLP